MTVKCLNTIQKAYIADCFEAKTLSINELAQMNGVSRRTIIRVLEEQGLDPGVKARAPKQLKLPFVIPTKTPWYRKLINSLPGLRSN